METLAPLSAYDVLRFTEGYLERLEAARELLEASPGHEPERGWLTSVLETLRQAGEAVPRVLEDARLLPDLAEVRSDFASELQNRWVDAVEKLFAGITFHVGSRAPILEALFPHQKFAALRKSPRDLAAAFGTELDRRLKSGYVTRIISQPEFAFAGPVVAQLQQAHADWQACVHAGAATEEVTSSARDALLRLGERLDGLIQQARWVAQAALFPLDGAFEASGLQAKPRKRTAPGAGVHHDLQSPAVEAPPQGDAEATLPPEAPKSRRTTAPQKAPHARS